MKLKLNSGRLWLRLVVLGSIFFICLTLLLQGILRWQFSESNVKAEIIALVAPTQRTVEFGDGMSRSWFPRPKATLHNIRISQADSPNTALSIDQLEFEFSWLDLLSKNPHPDRLLFQGVQLSVIREQDGSLSVDDLLRLIKKNKENTHRNRLQISKAAIDVEDKQTDVKFRLEDMDVIVKDYQLPGGTLHGVAKLLFERQEIALVADSKISKSKDVFILKDFTLKASSRFIRYGQTDLTLTAQAEYKPEDQFVLLKTLKANLVTETPQFQLNASGEKWQIYPNKFYFSNLNFQGSFPEIYENQNKAEFAGKILGIKLDKNILTAGSVQLQSGLHTSARMLNVNSIGNLHLDITSKEFSLRQMQILSHQVLKETNEQGLQGHLTGELKGVLGQNFALHTEGLLDANPMQFSLEYVHNEQNEKSELDHYRFNLMVDKLSFAQLKPKSDNKEGTVSQDSIAFFNSEQSFDLSFLNGIQVDGDIVVNELATSGIQIGKLQAHVKTAPDEITIDRINASVYQGKLNGSLKMSSNNGMPVLEVDQSIIGVNIQSFLRDLFGYERITGRGNGRILFKASGKNPKQMRSTLTGDVVLELSQGALLGVSLIDAFRTLPSQDKQNEYKVDTSSDQITPFTALKGSSHLENGIAFNKNLVLSSSLLNLRGEGKIDLSKELIDYTMYIASGSNPLGVKQSNVPLRITGNISSPVYSLDYNALTKGGATKEEKQKILREELIKQLNGLIK